MTVLHANTNAMTAISWENHNGFYMLSVGRPTDLYFTYEHMLWVGKYIYHNPINFKPHIHMYAVCVFYVWAWVVESVFLCVHVDFHKTFLAL